MNLKEKLTPCCLAGQASIVEVYLRTFCTANYFHIGPVAFYNNIFFNFFYLLCQGNPNSAWAT